MKQKTIRNILIAAGLSNITAVPLFSRFFTNTVIPDSDPAVMSNFGLLMIMVWGLAYISIANSLTGRKWIIGVFALEKLAYVCAWLWWQSHNSLSAVYAQDVMAGIFYSIYGLNDLIFMILFAAIFYNLHRSQGASS